ncbi:MAG: TrlF family AAA-like ATPase [Candidatus Heimdallarchaeota archaeon]
MNRGSIWGKWDLHVHTPESYSQEFKFTNEDEKAKYQDNIWGKYVDYLENISDISVIGITDYFTIEGYKKVLEYRKSGRLKNFDLILPNIEFRINQKNKDGDFINLHVIFSDKISVNKIEEILTRLPLISTDDETLTNKYCTKRDLESLGYKRAIVNCEKLVEQLEKDLRKIDDYFIIGVARGYGSVRPSRGDGRGAEFAKEIDKLSHAFFGNVTDVNFFLNKENGREQYNLSQKSVLYCSDAHRFEDIGCKFTWIKACPSFEGLKQIIYEPEERVRLQSENPEYRKNIYTLDSVKIRNSWINDELSIGEQEILLNRNLIAVTGGKGSGKTALLDLIANCFEDRCKRAGEDKNSFVQRIEDHGTNLEIEIGFAGDNIGEFSKRLMEEIFFQDSRITYLPQSKIEEYSGDRQKLDVKIKEIIFNNKEVIEGEYKQKFDEIGYIINEITKRIDEINREIYKLKDDTKKEILIEITSKKVIKEGELKNKEDELGKLIKNMKLSIKENIENLKEEESELQIKYSKLKGIKTKLEQFESELEEFIEVANETINDLNHDLSGLMIDLRISQLDIKPQLDVIKKLLELIPQRIKDVITEIKKKRGQLGQLSGIEKTHAEILKEMEDIKADIESFGNQLKQLEKKKELLKSLETERMRNFSDLLSKYWEWRKYYEDVIEVFSRGKSEIMSGINFKSSTYFNKNKFIELGLDILDQRIVKKDEIEKTTALLETIIIENTLDKLQGFIQKIFKYENSLKETRTNYDFYKWIFDNYFSLSTKIYFKEISINKLSMGQKGMVLLKLFLAEGDCPLIVDQPEESLDNKFIYDELVRAFKEAKKERQILIATNNANLVVNTDAEQIIVAEFDNNKITYKLGMLEDLKMREKIIPILEGGKEAFIKREEKYGI